MRFSVPKDPQNRSSGIPQLFSRSSFSTSYFVFYVVFPSCLLFTAVVSQAPTEKAPIKRVTQPPDRFQKLPDLVCNENTEHHCVCNRSLGNLDGVVPPCSAFIQVDELKVVTLTARNINLTARLHTSETYESYFKRRIASIVSNYCLHSSNECPEVVVRLDKVHASDFVLDDYDAPLLTQDNVILLRVEYSLPEHIGGAPDLVDTSISFVVAKAPLTESLDGYLTIPSQTIKVILGAQVRPLSRILGGVMIKELKVTSIVRSMPAVDNSNTRLQIIVTIFAVFFFFCYVIAIYRICRDTRRKRRAKKREAGLAGAEQANYGACTDKLLQNDHGKANGRRKSPSTDKLDVEGALQKTNLEQKHAPPNDSHFAVVCEESQEPALDQRRIQRMFDFDPSQLPAEPSFDEDEDYGMGCEVISQTAHRAESKVDKMDEVKERSEGPDVEPCSEALSIKPGDLELPSVVLVPSSSIHEAHPTEISVADVNKNYSTHCDPTEVGAKLLSSGYDSPPFERPRSRRGSRQSDDEAGEKDDLNSREVSPLPIGDNLRDAETLETPFVPIVTKSHTAHKFGHWSSDDSDVEHSEVYNKLAEEDEEKDQKRRKPHRRRRPLNSDEENSVEEEDEEEDEENVFDRHHYERLQESPMPPVSGDGVCYDSS